VTPGEEVIIARAGTAVAKFVPFETKRRLNLGSAKGEFVVPDDFNDSAAERDRRPVLQIKLGLIRMQHLRGLSQ
jgi:antitoxin (DNA-binding transcriptional repressor) of toxin-antitoxin stability system